MTVTEDSVKYEVPIHMGCPTCHSEEYYACNLVSTTVCTGYCCKNGHHFPQPTIWQEVAIEQENKL